MKRSRVWIRALLGLTLVAACMAAAIAPALSMVQAAPPPAPPSASAAPGNLVISSFRFAGAAGPTDEYIAIYNRSCSATIDLSTYQLRASAAGALPQWTFDLPAGASIGPQGTYVIAGSQYAPVAGEPAANATYPDDVDAAVGGVALFDGTGAGANQLDAAGFSGDGYVEGTALAPLAANTQSYFRETSASQYVDRNNNVADFTAQASGAPPSATCGIPTIQISGTTGVSGTTLTYVDIAPRVVTSTGTNGAYSFYVLKGWAGTVTPSLLGYAFTPASLSYAAGDTQANLPNQNFIPAANTGTPSPTSGVVINEVAYAGTIGNSNADWIELYNTTATDINLSGWVLEAQDGVPTIELTGTIKAGGFYLVAQTTATGLATSTPTSAATPGCLVFKPADGVVVNQYFYGALSTYGETLFLVNQFDTVVDYANRNGGIWPAGTTSSFYQSRSMERHAASLPDSDTNWYTFRGNPTVHDCSGNFVYGTPGYANWAVSVTATPSPRPTRTITPIPPTPFAHMVLNEFLPRAGYDWNQDGKVDVYDEFVELYNLGPVNSNLNGWRIDVISPGGNSSYSLSGLTMKPGDRMVFYRLKSNVELPDMGGTVRLINSRGVIVDARGYDAVQAPDQSICRIPDGQYWRFPCFPTPGLQNSLTGTHPVPPPAIAPLPPPCVMSDIIPTPFREAECYPFGADVYNPAYWDDQAGFREFAVPDRFNKWRAVVE